MVGYYYFIDKEGDVCRVRMSLTGRKEGMPEKIKKAGIKKEDGYLYFLNKDGNVARAKIIKRGKILKNGISSQSTSNIINNYIFNTVERIKWAELRKRFVFLSYSHKDKKVVSHINGYLKRKGINTWFDEDKLKGGHIWETEIKKAINECILFVPFLSNNSVNSKGYFQSEAKSAQDVWNKIPEGKPYIIPIVIEDNVIIPISLEKIHVIREKSIRKLEHTLYETLKYHIEQSINYKDSVSK
jgi:hypothetical protein